MLQLYVYFCSLNIFLSKDNMNLSSQRNSVINRILFLIKNWNPTHSYLINHSVLLNNLIIIFKIDLNLHFYHYY